MRLGAPPVPGADLGCTAKCYEASELINIDFKKKKRTISVISRGEKEKKKYEQISVPKTLQDTPAADGRRPRPDGRRPWPDGRRPWPDGPPTPTGGSW